MRRWHDQTLKELGTSCNQKLHENICSSLFTVFTKNKLPYLRKVDIECLPSRSGEIDFWYLAVSTKQYVAGKYERRKKSKNRVIVKEPIFHLTLRNSGYIRFFTLLNTFFFRMAKARKTRVSANGLQLHVFPNCQTYDTVLPVQNLLNISLDGVYLQLKTLVGNYNKCNANEYIFSLFKASYLT